MSSPRTKSRGRRPPPKVNPPAGSGQKFKACVRTMRRRPGVRSPKGLCATLGRRKYGAAGMARLASKGRRRRNQEDPEVEAAARLSEKFHGRPASKIRTVETLEYTPDTLADLGGLTELHVATPQGGRLLPFGHGVRLACTPDGQQLYIVGGDQELDLEALGLLDRANVEVGELARVVYDTRKGFHNFERTHYVHDMGEGRGGRRPTLGYDALNHQLFIVGGTYSVRPEGITN